MSKHTPATWEGDHLPPGELGPGYGLTPPSAEVVPFKKARMQKASRNYARNNELGYEAIKHALDLDVTPRLAEMRPDDVLRNTGLKPTPGVERIAYKAVKLALSGDTPNVR